MLGRHIPVGQELREAGQIHAGVEHEHGPPAVGDVLSDRIDFLGQVVVLRAGNDQQGAVNGNLHFLHEQQSLDLVDFVFELLLDPVVTRAVGTLQVSFRVSLNEVDGLLALEHVNEGVGNAFLGRALGFEMAVACRYHNRAVGSYRELLGQARLTVRVHVFDRDPVRSGGVVVQQIVALTHPLLPIENVQRDVAIEPLQ